MGRHRINCRFCVNRPDRSRICQQAHTFLVHSRISVRLYLPNFMFKTKLFIFCVCVCVGGEKMISRRSGKKTNKRTFVNNFNEKLENTYFIINADNKCLQHAVPAQMLKKKRNRQHFVTTHKEFQPKNFTVSFFTKAIQESDISDGAEIISSVFKRNAS